MLGALTALCCFATDPRKQPTDYPAHTDTPKVAIGAEYLVHSVPTGHETFFLPNVLVVDTALYPKGGEFKIDAHAFTLRINGNGVLAPMAPAMAAYSMGMNQTFRGQNGSRQLPPGQAPTTQDPNQPDNQSNGPEAPADAMVRLALQDGQFHSPQGGFLYFPFSGKTKTIKSLDLVYTGSGGEVIIPLF
jgi:hypothetical protein